MNTPMLSVPGAAGNAWCGIRFSAATTSAKLAAIPAGIIAHQHGAQARVDALRIERGHANGELGLHGSGSGFSIKNRRGHVRILPCPLR
jgi:hypothetical protein